MQRSFLDRTSTVTPAIVVVVFAAILVAGGLFVSTILRDTFATVAELQTARTASFRLIKAQLDEETGLRGFTSTGDPVFLDPYKAATASYDDAARALRAALRPLNDVQAMADAESAMTINTTWQSQIAQALIGSTATGTDPGAQPSQGALANRYRALMNDSRSEMSGKVLVDKYRALMDDIDQRLIARQTDVNAAAQRAIGNVLLFALVAIGIIAALGALAARARNRYEKRIEEESARAERQARLALTLSTAYETEKRIADTLQAAFAQRPLPSVPALSFSATYIPASDEAKVGGDWYDAVEAGKDRVLFALGDVEGHGIEAAVNMSRARQSLIAAALGEGSDPAAVLTRVNEALLNTGRMATAVTGFANALTYEFIYATAGHPPPLLLEPGRPPRLMPTGGLPLGVIEGATYTTHRVQAVPGSVLVLYTDGAVEHSRDVLEGEALLIEAAERGIESKSSDLAAAMRAHIFEHHPIGDDVAILTIGFSTDSRRRLTLTSDHAKGSIVSQIGSSITGVGTEAILGWLAA